MTFKRRYHSIDDVLANTRRSENGCMEWLGALNRDGYAACTGKRLFKSQVVHREVFRLATGQTPEVVMHTCDNRRCINPAHLVGGTPADNMQDKLNKGRQAKGVQNGNAKLTEADVHRLLQYRKQGYTYAQLQLLFGIARVTVWRITSGRNWGYLCKS